MPPIEFNVPVMGERGDLTDRELPPQALRLCQNMWRNEEGNLVVRPGYGTLSLTNPGDRIMGIHYWRTAAGAHKLIALTLTKMWVYNYSTLVWEDKSGTALSGGTTNHVRAVTFNTSGTFKVVFVNGVNSDKIWDGATSTYGTLGGSPTGNAIDVAVCANRLLLMRSPFNIQVSDFNDPETYPTGNGFNFALIDGSDFGVGMERFNRTSVAAFGEESQWVIRAQTGSIPFRVEKVSDRIGPLSSAAIVAAGGVIYYLGRDYNVYRFDGVNNVEVGWAMKPFVRANIDETNQTMTHGYYHEKHGKIVWVFPPSGSSLPSYGIFLDIKTGEMGRIIYGAGMTASGRVLVAAGVTWASLSSYTWANIDATYPTWDSFGSQNNRREVMLGNFFGLVHVIGLGDGSDNGAAIEAIWEVPLHSYGGWDMNYVPDTAETFFKKSSNATTVDLSLAYTNTLMSTPSTMPMASFDIATDQRNDIDLTSLGEARFLTVRHRCSTRKGQLTWQGMLLHGEPAGIEKGPVG